ncbi:MAG: hypothetical protein NC252_03140 [Roseburia sp.]|nr:hypothetical protein [Roseburia sp.]
MENKIQVLADKLFQEGVAKGNAEAEKIIASAKVESDNIVNAAIEKAESIIADAKKNAQVLEDNTKAELKMFTLQALNALKTEIANVVSDKIIGTTVNDLTQNKNFINDFILNLASKWAENEDIVISTSDADSLKSLFAAKAKALLDSGVKIEQVNGLKVLFTIQPADGTYKVNFGKEEFENYFKSFLRPQLIDMLF